MGAEIGTAFENLERADGRGIAVGQPDDIANAVSFLAGERSGFVSGQVLCVAGTPVGSPQLVPWH